MLHHTTNPVCPLCEEKLSTAHDQLAEWFREMKREFSNLHVAWAFREKEAQEQAFREGKSRARWPQSRHNHVQDGKPCSLALDLFQLDCEKAIFSPNFYFRLNELTQKMAFPIAWGGSFRAIKDLDHFEISE